MHRSAAVLTTCLTLACGTTTPVPEDAGTGSDGGESTGPPPTTTADPGDDDDSSGDDGPALPPPDPFKLDHSNVKLLPFRVRFNKLQALLGQPAEDPMFDVLRARRYELGDYDYAAGVTPDLTWNAARISVWISAMLPVCRSPQMHARFPAFPDSLGDLMTAAYGAAVAPEQLADYEDLLGDASLDDAARYDTICASVLTALEFVAQ
jgi:hypothetical protein